MSFQSLILSSLASSLGIAFAYQMKMPSPENSLFFQSDTDPCGSNVPVDPKSLVWPYNGTAPWFAEPGTTVYNNTVVTSVVNALMGEMVPGLPTTFGQTFSVFQNADCLLYMHGGAIRDFLLGLSPKDIDVEYSCTKHALTPIAVNYVI